MDRFDYEKDMKDELNDNLKYYLDSMDIDPEVLENALINDDEDVKYQIKEELEEFLRANDFTGNMSGSKTMSRWAAEENICHNMELLGEALEVFGCDGSFITEHGAEGCDVTIREYLLGQIVSDVVDDTDLMKKAAYGITVENFQEKLQEEIKKQSENGEVDIQKVASSLKEKMPSDEVEKLSEILFKKGCTDLEKTESFFKKMATSKENLLHIKEKEHGTHER